MLSQTSHKPRFPIVNHNIYFHQNMAAPIRAPVASGLAFFQPSMWGFFIGRDLGVAWLWWFLVFGTFLSSFLFFLEVTDQSRFLSWVGALLIVASPFFQLWSFHKAEIFAGALFSTVFSLNLFRAETFKQKFLWSLALGWAFSEFVFGHIYPPYQVLFSYFILLSFVAYIKKKEVRLPLKINALYVLVSFSVFLVGLFFFIQNSGSSIALLSQTSYPGQRSSVGGGIPLWHYYSNHFFLRHWIKDYGTLSNICESAFGFFLFPGLVCETAVRFYQTKRFDGVAWAFIGTGLLLMGFSSLGTYPVVAKFSLLSMVPSNRIGMLLLLTDVSLLLHLIRSRRSVPLPKPLLAKVMPPLVVFLFLSLSGLAAIQSIPEFPMLLLLFCPLLFSLLFYILFETRFTSQALLFLVLGNFLYSMSFNPLVRGGTGFLFNNPLSAKILELRQKDPSARWASFGIGHGGDLLRALGVPSFGGYQGVPNFDAWHALDPLGKNRDAYNLAGLVYLLPSADAETVFSRNHHVLTVSLSPRLLPSALNIRYLLVSSELVREMDQSSVFYQLFTYGNFAIYALLGRGL